MVQVLATEAARAISSCEKLQQLATSTGPAAGQGCCSCSAASDAALARLLGLAGGPGGL